MGEADGKATNDAEREAAARRFGGEIDAILPALVNPSQPPGDGDGNGVEFVGGIVRMAFAHSSRIGAPSTTQRR